MMFIYGVRDRKRARFTQTYTDFTNESAIRTFLTICQDPRTTLGMYPSDYELYNLAQLIEETGEVIPVNIYLETGRKDIAYGILQPIKQAEDEAE